MALFSQKRSDERRCAGADRYFGCSELLRLLDACPHDYRSRSLLVDRLYLLLLYREFFPLPERERAALFNLLNENITFFTRLPRARAVPRLTCLNALHRRYLGDLAFCRADLIEALAQYSAVRKLKSLRGAAENARLGKTDAADFHELLPLLWNISQAFNLLGLCDRSRALYRAYGDLVHLRRQELEAASQCEEARAELAYLADPGPVKALLLPPVRYDLREDAPPAYDFCCEERYSPALGKTCQRFHSGLADGVQRVPITLSQQEGTETFAIAFCSLPADRKELTVRQAARAAVLYHTDSFKEK